MTDLPILGAALPYKHVVNLKDWIFEKDRTLELQDFCNPADIGKDFSDLIAAYKNVLTDYRGEFGIHGPFYGLDIANPDKDIRAIVQQRLLDGLDICEQLGATHMVVHSPFTFWHSLNFRNYETQNEALFAASTECLAPVVQRAENIGCTLMLENIEDTDPALRRDLISSIDSSNLMISIDTGHAFLAHGQYKAPPVWDFILDAGKQLGHVHLQDADGYADRHWHPGEGMLPWGAIFKTLADTGASPRLILEVHDRQELLPRTAARLEVLELAC